MDVFGTDEHGDVDARLTAARYYVHKLRAHQYAQSVNRGEMPLETALKRYQDAMRNYDQIIDASGHNSQEANQGEMAKGASAIEEQLRKMRRG
jgi:hypothetical protein